MPAHKHTSPGVAAVETGLTFQWLTPSRWKHLEALFGERGGCGGCWCMVWRLSRADYVRNKGAGNRRALRKLVDTSARPGVIAYLGREPVGWCAIAPRGAYSFLERSRVLAPVDDKPVWSITCLLVAKPYRRLGLSSRLLRATAEMAIARGASAVEGYPVSPYSEKVADAFIWTGTRSAFMKAGFEEVARRSPTRPIMRFGG